MTKLYTFILNLFRLHDTYVGIWKGDVLTGHRLYKGKKHD